MSYIVGIDQGFLLIVSFSFLKSVMMLTPQLFFGTQKVDAAHSLSPVYSANALFSTTSLVDFFISGICTTKMR